MSRINGRLDRQMRHMLEADAKDRSQNSVLADKEDELRAHRLKIEYMIRVLWECLMEMGVTREDVDRKMQEIEERGWTINPSGYYRMCPDCGKKVFDYTSRVFEATCVYCGTVVPMYPGDIDQVT
ncbi:MAG: hypothetical protein J5750_03200 [Clostridiales bacterium]|nr:hypothetical protein [Clostridiales bacterium]